MGSWPRWLLVFNPAAALLAALPVLCQAEKIPVKEQAAIEKIFSGTHDYRRRIKTLDGQEFAVITVGGGGRIAGWAVVTDEPGKNKPITFLTAVGADEKVLAVTVLEYRDMFGSEIRRRSFVGQFRNKTAGSALKIGGDIDAVTGATISSHAATSAVRKSLQIIEQLDSIPD